MVAACCLNQRREHRHEQHPGLAAATDRFHIEGIQKNFDALAGVFKMMDTENMLWTFDA
jgi:hypothetical protein